MVSRADAALALAAWRVDVHAADDVAGAAAEHGVGEPAAPGEVLSVALEVAQVLGQGHLVWPALPGESCGQLFPANPGVAWMRLMLTVRAAWSAALC